MQLKGLVVRRTLSTVAAALFLCWAAWYVWGHKTEFIPILSVSLLDVAVLYAAFLTVLFCNALFLKESVALYGARLQNPESWGLSLASSFANYFLPFRGGAGLRAYYLTKVHDLRITEFAATLGAMYVLHISVNGLLGLLGLVAFARQGHPADPLVYAFFLVPTVSCLAFMALSTKPFLSRDSWPLRLASRLASSWTRLRENRLVSQRLWIITLLLAVATIWQCDRAFSAIGRPLPLSGILVYASAKNLAFLASITPGSLGVVEGVSIYLGRTLGYSLADALLVQGLIRAVSLSVLLLAGPVAIHLLRIQSSRSVKSSPAAP